MTHDLATARGIALDQDHMKASLVAVGLVVRAPLVQSRRQARALNLRRVMNGVRRT